MNTSGNDIIRTFIDRYAEEIQEDFEELLAGKFIRMPIKEDLIYDLLHSSKDNFWSILYLTGYITGAGYRVESNKEHGEGRSDIVVKDTRNFRVAVFEIKYADKKADLGKSCEKALAQIINRQYTVDYVEDYDEILCYGIAFYKKRCLVKKG